MLLLQTPRIHFDFGSIAALPSELQRLGISRPLLVTDKNLARLEVFDRVRIAIPSTCDAAIFADVAENPTAAAVHQCIAAYREHGCDGIVAVGGGSVIDCAKAAALLGTNAGDLSRYLGQPENITAAPAPLIAIPTTAGTGSEVSRGCGIHPDPTSRTKGINHPLMVPPVAICDPELTLTLPPRLTAGTGLDALTHCIEGFLSKTVNPLVDAIALDGIRRVFSYLERAVHDGSDREARWQVMMAAVQGGLSIYKGLGPAHAIANTCGDRGLHHGMLSVLAMPPVLRLFEARGNEKIQALSQAMGCKPGKSAADMVQELNGKVGIPPSIAALGYGEADLDELASDAANSFFNAPSPYRPTFDEYRDILDGLFARRASGQGR
jgi:alcohol dehydrogenase class IV